MLISDSRFDLVWFRLSCDHGWIRSGSVNVRNNNNCVDGCIHADDSSELGGTSCCQVVIGMKPEEAATQLATFQDILILPMKCQQEEVVKLSSEQHKKFDPGG